MSTTEVQDDAPDGSRGVEMTPEMREQSLREQIQMLEARLSESRNMNRRVAHELKEPLTILAGLCSLMSLRHGPTMHPDLATGLSKMVHEVRRMAVMVDEAAEGNRRAAAEHLKSAVQPGTAFGQVKDSSFGGLDEAQSGTLDAKRGLPQFWRKPGPR